MKALVIIDMQNDFIPGGSLEVPGGDKLVPVINRIQEKFGLVIATQDWHPEDHISFASNHPGKEPFSTIQWKGMNQVLWPDHCIQKSTGADFHPDLDMGRVEAVIRKGMDKYIDSYSGFYDNGHEKSTGLAGYLRERNANELYFCGLAADVCVLFSITDALNCGFSVKLIEDATRPIDADEFENMKKNLWQKGCKFVNSDEFALQ